MAGLIELKHPITCTESIQPAKFPNNCNEIDASDMVCAAGNGRIVEDIPARDTTLRHGYFKMQSDEQCADSMDMSILDVASIICADPIDERSFGGGDSGKMLADFNVILINSKKST